MRPPKFVAWKDLAPRQAQTFEDGSVWTARTGEVRLANGEVRKALLDFCESDSNEHYGTRILVADEGCFDPFDESSFAIQGQEDFFERLGLSEKDVYPYKYRYNGEPCDDHHIGDDGWSR